MTERVNVQAADARISDNPRSRRHYRVGVIPGDGIGPEVVEQGVRCLRAAAVAHGVSLELVSYPFGAEHYLRTGEMLPRSAMDELRQLDAIYFGAAGDPRLPPGLVERELLLALRYEFDLYVNLRPVKLYAAHFCPLKDTPPSAVDFVFVRENTEDAYPIPGGFLRRDSEDEVAIGTMIYTRKGVERCARFAFDLARRRGKQRRVTLVDQANAIQAHGIWTRVVRRVADEYPDVELDHEYADSAAMRLIQQPAHFDVLLTPNYIGGILSDLGAMLQGGLGASASGNVRPGAVSMFEPVHGSAPKYAGRRVASPIGAIGAARLLFEHLGERGAADALDRAIAGAVARLPSARASSGVRTDEVGDMVLAALDA